jgi:hypothetical protein
VALTLEPVSFDSYNNIIPDPDTIWYLEPADGASFSSAREVDKTIAILNDRSVALLDRLVTFEPDPTWGIIIHFNNPNTPVNLDTLEQLASHPGKVSVFSSPIPPSAGEMLALSANVHLSEDHIGSTEADGLQNPVLLKLFLNDHGKTILAPLPKRPLYLAVDDEVISSLPLVRVSDFELQLSGLEFEKAKLLSVLINPDSLPFVMHVNMEETGG